MRTIDEWIAILPQRLQKIIQSIIRGSEIELDWTIRYSSLRAALLAIDKVLAESSSYSSQSKEKHKLDKVNRYKLSIVLDTLEYDKAREQEIKYRFPIDTKLWIAARVADVDEDVRGGLSDFPVKLHLFPDYDNKTEDRTYWVPQEILTDADCWVSHMRIRDEKKE